MQRWTGFRPVTLAAALCFAAGILFSQSDPLAQLNPEQRSSYDAAVLSFQNQRFAEALATLRPLLAQLVPGTPAQIQVAEYAAESAINANDRDFALQLLKPIETADANDWKASGMLARIYAETGQKALRDSELAHLVDLHKRAVSPDIAKLPQVILERVPLTTGQLLIFYSLEPWGNYKTYVYARLYDRSSQLVLRITLESSDFDQKFFADEHPDLAAKGQRRFSLDGYRDGPPQPNGQKSQTHMTFKMFDGQPPYDSVREQMIAIAEGQAKPTIQSTKPVPQPK